MYIIAGKNSASWQLVAAVDEQSGKKNDVKLEKPAQNQRKIRLNSKCNFLVAVVIEIFSRYNVHVSTITYYAINHNYSRLIIVFSTSNISDLLLIIVDSNYLECRLTDREDQAMAETLCKLYNLDSTNPSKVVGKATYTRLIVTKVWHP